MDIISQMKKIWPDWTVVDKIGAGSYGHVYKVSRIVADRTYYSAVKVITVPQNEGEVKAVFAEEGSHSATKAHFKELVDDCIREITIMMDLRGASNVVEVEDFKVIEYENEIRWDIFIRMEYLTCLTDIITQRKLSEKEVAKIGVDLCSALEICEKKQVIHRDIKPGNIFVSEFGTYKLGDFGIAREMDRASGTLSSRGTKDMNLNSDACDCIWSGFTKEGREEDYTWGITYAADAYFVLVQSDSDINTLGDLKNKTVGVLGGSKQYDLGSDSDIIEYTDITPMVNELKAGVIDAAVVDNTIGQFIIKNY